MRGNDEVVKEIAKKLNDDIKSQADNNTIEDAAVYLSDHHNWTSDQKFKALTKVYPGQNSSIVAQYALLGAKSKYTGFSDNKNELLGILTVMKNNLEESQFIEALFAIDSSGSNLANRIEIMARTEVKTEAEAIAVEATAAKQEAEEKFKEIKWFPGFRSSEFKAAKAKEAAATAAKQKAVKAVEEAEKAEEGAKKAAAEAKTEKKNLSSPTSEQLITATIKESKTEKAIERAAKTEVTDKKLQNKIIGQKLRLIEELFDGDNDRLTKISVARALGIDIGSLKMNIPFYETEKEFRQFDYVGLCRKAVRINDITEDNINNFVSDLVEGVREQQWKMSLTGTPCKKTLSPERFRDMMVATCDEYKKKGGNDEDVKEMLTSFAKQYDSMPYYFSPERHKYRQEVILEKVANIVFKNNKQEVQDILHSFRPGKSYPDKKLSSSPEGEKHDQLQYDRQKPSGMGVKKTEYVKLGANNVRPGSKGLG